MLADVELGVRVHGSSLSGGHEGRGERDDGGGLEDHVDEMAFEAVMLWLESLMRLIRSWLLEMCGEKEEEAT